MDFPTRTGCVCFAKLETCHTKSYSLLGIGPQSILQYYISYFYPPKQRSSWLKYTSDQDDEWIINWNSFDNKFDKQTSKLLLLTYV